MWMSAIAIRKNREAKFPIPVAKQKCRVTRYAAAVRDVAIAVANLRPPGQPKPGSLVPPDVFDGAFELVVLAREHLIQGLLADQPLPFKDSAIEVRNQPVRLIEHGAIDDPCRPD